VKVSITTTHKEGLVVGMRSMPGNPYDGHTLAEALEQAAILSDTKPEVAIVDRGYKGVAVDGVKIYHPGLRRGITRTLRAMIRRRSAIEPAIGHMKTDGKLDRNWLKGALGDAMHAVLCGAGHNLRMILRKLRLLCVFVLAALFNRGVAAVPSPQRRWSAKRIVQDGLSNFRITPFRTCKKQDVNKGYPFSSTIPHRENWGV
jgi:IS5 family transposase